MAESCHAFNPSLHQGCGVQNTCKQGHFDHGEPDRVVDRKVGQGGLGTHDKVLAFQHAGDASQVVLVCAGCVCGRHT